MDRTIQNLLFVSSEREIPTVSAMQHMKDSPLFSSTPKKTHQKLTEGGGADADWREWGSELHSHGVKSHIKYYLSHE